MKQWSLSNKTFATFSSICGKLVPFSTREKILCSNETLQLSYTCSMCKRHGVNVIKLFFLLAHGEDKQARVFYPEKYFYLTWLFLKAATSLPH